MPMPPPSTTAGTSMRFTAEAMPVPRAATAVSISSRATSSSWSSARSHRPLVSRSRPLSSMSLNRRVLRLAGGSLHRAAARVGLHAPAVAAGAAPALALDDGVPDLAGAAAPGPGLSVEDEAAADARPPEDAEHRVVGLGGAEAELAQRRQVHVVADPHACAHVPLELLGQRIAD